MPFSKSLTLVAAYLAAAVAVPVVEPSHGPHTASTSTSTFIFPTPREPIPVHKTTITTHGTITTRTIIGIGPVQPITTATPVDKRVIPGICDDSIACKPMVNACGVPYEICIGPVCQGEPVPTHGSAPPCPSGTGSSAVAPTGTGLSRRVVCDESIVCESKTNACGVAYQVCIGPTCQGEPVPTSGTAPPCPATKKNKRIIPTPPPNSIDERMCEIVPVCATLTNSCGVPYQSCDVPACAGGPVAPTVPPCPAETAVAARAAKAAAAHCDIAFVCETLTNSCGIEYQGCYVPACAGGPATPTPTGVVPPCPTS